MENYTANLSMMKRCRLYIDENLHDKKLLQGPALAQHFDCSYTNFRRIFLAIGGYTVHEYVQTRRVQKAAMCLRKGQSMEEAKASSGYGSDVGFRKAFISVSPLTNCSVRSAASMGRKPGYAPRFCRC